MYLPFLLWKKGKMHPVCLLLFVMIIVYVLRYTTGFYIY